MSRCRGVLFDLDGTLADTAADLTRALNRVLAELDRPPKALEDTRPHVSLGAAVLLRIGLDTHPGDPRIGELFPRLLRFYAEDICVETRLFPAIDTLLDSLRANGTPWGIVTNKPRAYTGPLLDALPLPVPPSTVICADDLPHRKPHPLPIRRACQVLEAAPGDCLYVGDDRRDIVAGFRAGAWTAAAAWGYLGPDEDPATWGADIVADDAAALIDRLPTASRQRTSSRPAPPIRGS